MKSKPEKPLALEDLPNIGKSIANDLRAIGLATPAHLRQRDPLGVFNDLKKPMGPRHDPCVFYTLLAVQHFLKTSESLPWWRFTAEGQAKLNRKPARA